MERGWNTGPALGLEVIFLRKNKKQKKACPLSLFFPARYNSADLKMRCIKGSNLAARGRRGVPSPGSYRVTGF